MQLADKIEKTLAAQKGYLLLWTPVAFGAGVCNFILACIMNRIYFCRGQFYAVRLQLVFLPRDAALEIFGAV